MFLPSANIKVYLAMGSTGMRKSINGLSIPVSGHLELDPSGVQAAPASLYRKELVCIHGVPLREVSAIYPGLDELLRDIEVL